MRRTANRIFKEHRVVIVTVTAVLLFFSRALLAQTGPLSLNIGGGLFQANGAAVTNSNVNFRFELYDKAGSCVLYSEEHLGVDLSQSKGRFSLTFGKGSNPQNLLESSMAFTARLFQNDGVPQVFTGCPGGVTLSSGDERVIRVHYDLGSGYVAMSPDVGVESSGFALVADTLRGKTPSDFVQLRDDATYDLTQANVQNVFSATNYARLNTLLSSSGSFSFGSQRITSVADPTSAQDAATKNYTDTYVAGKQIDLQDVAAGTGDGKVLTWDATQDKWVAQAVSATDSSKLPLAGGTMSGAIHMGSNNLLATGHITMSAQTTLNLGTYTDAQETTLVGTLAAVDKGKSWYNSDDNVFKVWDGSRAVTQAYLSNTDKIQASWLPDTTVTGGSYGSATQVATFTVGADGRLTAAGNTTISGVSPGGSAGGDLTGSYPNPTIASDVITSAKVNSTGVAVNRLLITNASDGSTIGYATCSLGEVMKWTASGWACASDDGGSGDITEVAAGTGLAGGGTSGAVTLAVDVGTTAGQIVQIAAGDKLPTVDGSDLTNVNAVKLQTRSVASTAPNNGEVLTWNNTTSVWEPSTVSALISGSYFVQDGNSFGVPTVLGTNDAQPLHLETNDTTRITVTASGNVGIGTTSPAAPLTVSSNVNAGTYSIFDAGTAFNGAYKNISVRQVGVETAFISPTQFYIGGGQGGAGNSVTIRGNASILPVVYGNSANGNRVGLFGLGGGTAGTGAGIVGQSGANPGIIAESTGTTNDALVITSRSLTSGRLLFVEHTNSAFTGDALQMNLGQGTGSFSGNFVNLKTNGSSQFLITSAGRVGIGTSSPNSMLDVAGQIRATHICATDGSNCRDLTTSWGAGGSVTEVTAGSGLSGGTITTSGTLSVDVGTTAGKIVQMAADDKLPAVDGSDLTNVNAVKLQTRSVASTAPNDGEVLKWNSATSVWEPSADSDTDTGITALTGDVSASGTGSVTATLADAAVTSVKIADGTIATADMADDAVISAKLNSAGVAVNRLLITDASTGTKVQYASCSTDEVLKWTASGWACSAVSSLISGSYFSQNGNSFGTETVLGTNDTQPLQFETNGATRLTITAGGDVGIGTTNPTTGLHVHKSTFFFADSSGSNPILYANVGKLAVGTSSTPGYKFSVHELGAKTTNTTAMYIDSRGISSSASIAKVGLNIQSTGIWNGAGATNTGLIVNVSGGTTNYAATFDGGNVGIGVTNPSSPLHVSATNTVTSGATYALQITPTYNQTSGTAANTDLLVNRTETAVGSGTQRLLDLQVSGSSQFNVDNAGNVTAQGTLSAKQAYVTLTDAATVTWSVAGIINNAKVTLGGNRTLAFSGLTNGMSGTLIVIQDGSGGRTLTLPAQCTNKVIGGGSGSISLSTAAGAVDILSFTYDGTNCYWTYGKNYN